ncbi:MAG: hypothetical protein ACK2T0_07425 [Anaerolineales bacterium]
MTKREIARNQETGGTTVPSQGALLGSFSALMYSNRQQGKKEGEDSGLSLFAFTSVVR